MEEAREKEASRQEQSRTQERTLKCVEEERAVFALLPTSKREFSLRISVQ